MIRILATLSVLLLPAVLLAHETAGAAHLHPHGSEWLPVVALAGALSVAFFLYRRFAGR